MTENHFGFLTRRVALCAAHRLHSLKLSDEENKRLYSKCNNPNGHGHNYVIKVTVRGPVDDSTGMVMDASVLKKHMEETIMQQMDHKHLDNDIEYFASRPSTVENICIFVWKMLEPRFKDERCSLHKVKVHETENIHAVYKG